MNFEWDAGKNRSNIRKHGSDLADAAETFWLSFESTGKVIKPLSTRSFENMSRVASGARASCYTVSARALKFHTESRTKPYSPMPHARARPRSTHPSNRAGLLRLRQKH